MATLSETNLFVATYLGTIDWPKGFTYSPRLYANGKLVFVVFRKNMESFTEKELVAITDKIGSVMRYLRANGIDATLKVEDHA